MRVILLLLLLSLAGGCAKPVLEPLELYPGLGEELLLKVKQQNARFQTLKGMASIKLRYGTRSMNFSNALVLQKPDRLRLEILSPFGASYLQASSDGERLSLYVPTKGRFYTGPPSSENLQLLTQMPIELEQMISLLLYEVPLLSGPVVAVEARGQEGYVLTLQQGDRRQQLQFDRAKRLVGSYWYRGDLLDIEITYADFVYGSNFPAKIRLEQPRLEALLQTSFEDPETNVVIDPRLFSLTPPAGVLAEPFPRGPATGAKQ
ncbi:MAG: hypothetical protein C0624_06355 [Desulfuromonas sp.]|nr:MAG: hypothetical protein C0624_06355 [Desulfuromonas sp.]